MIINSSSFVEEQCKRQNPLNLDNILDVTLRDGGYLNDWQFSSTEITKTLSFLYRMGLRKIEVGFLRTPEKSTSIVNECPLDFLEHINHLYPDVSFACMLHPTDDNWQRAVADKLSYISLVRIPFTADNKECALEIADGLHEQSSNIQVSLNLISVSSYSLHEIEYLLKKISLSESVDIIYFADSRGALYPDKVQSIVSLARDISSRPMGFHAHDTQGKAVENSDCAFRCGCDWIDVTLNGYGLAGGNTSLGAYLARHDLLPRHIDPADILHFCNSYLSLSHPEEKIRQAYRVLAQKNIDPIWHKSLEEHYPGSLNAIVEKAPQRDYKTLESVLDALTTL